MTRLQARDPMTRVCAWCGCVIGADNQPTPHKPSPGALVTHGICETCRAKHFRLPRREVVTCAHCGRPIAEDAQGYCMHCGLAQLPESDLAAAARVLA